MHTKNASIGKHFAPTSKDAADIKDAATPERTARPKKKRGKDILAAILAVVGIALLITGGWLWWDAQSQYNFQAETNEKLSGYARVSDDGSTPPQVDWASLKAVNGDVCAWIQVPGTPINFPVYKGATNDTYLRTNAFGSYSIGGQVFLDSENTSADLTQEQTIAYGHHLNDGSMFAALAKMDEQSYFDSIKRVWWVVPIAHDDGTYGQENFLCEPLCCYRVSGDDKTVRTFQWSSPSEFHSYLSNKLSSAETKAANAEADIPSIELVLTLVTCNYTEGEGRTVVVCNPTQQTTQDTVQY